MMSAVVFIWDGFGKLSERITTALRGFLIVRGMGRGRQRRRISIVDWLVDKLWRARGEPLLPPLPPLQPSTWNVPDALYPATLLSNIDRVALTWKKNNSHGQVGMGRRSDLGLILARGLGLETGRGKASVVNNKIVLDRKERDNTRGERTTFLTGSGRCCCSVLALTTYPLFLYSCRPPPTLLFPCATLSLGLNL